MVSEVELSGTSFLQGLHQILLPDSLHDMRPLILVSLGAEVIRVGKEKFCELIDSETIEKLSKFKIMYPRSVLEMCVHSTRSNAQFLTSHFSKRKKQMLIPNNDKGRMKHNCWYTWNWFNPLIIILNSNNNNVSRATKLFLPFETMVYLRIYITIGKAAYIKIFIAAIFIIEKQPSPTHICHTKGIV